MTPGIKNHIIRYTGYLAYVVPGGARNFNHTKSYHQAKIKSCEEKHGSNDLINKDSKVTRGDKANKMYINMEAEQEHLVVP